MNGIATAREIASLATLPRELMAIVADYATTWREIFFEFLVGLPITVRDGEGMAEAVIQVLCVDADGRQCMRDLTIGMRLRSSFEAKRRRAVSKGPIWFSRGCAPWAYGSFEEIWKKIAARELSDGSTLRAAGLRAVVGIEGEIIAAALAGFSSRWLTRRTWPSRHRTSP